MLKALRLGGVSVGNSVTVYCDGDAAMKGIWQAIAAARRRVWFEMYIFEPDSVGRRTLFELTQAAQRGCEVRFMVDAVGSPNLTEALLRPLRDAGAHIEIFKPIRYWPWRWSRALFRRDHRKIIVVDNRVGFCGGMNISEDYAGAELGNSRFLDCHLRMEGPCVRDLAAVFTSSWRMATDNRLRVPARTAETGGTFVQVQASRGAHGRRAIQRALRLTIRNAVTHCFITTPYFVPPLRLVRAIKKARERNVDVRILTAGLCDVPMVHLAAQHVYGSLLRHGVRVFELFDTTLHAKTITIDGVYCTVGSFNLDTWSDQRNLEVNVAMVDPTIAGELQDHFLKNLDQAREMTMDTWQKRRWWRRVLHWVAYQVMRL